MPPKKQQSKSSESSIQSIAIAKIRMDGGTQPRSKLYEDVVGDYIEDMKQGAEFPPVIVFYDGTEYWLADGFHRVRAREAIGVEEIAAEVIPGELRDAILYSVGANASHGFRRTNADKHRAIERLLRDPEWSRWSDREIARRCSVTGKMVGAARRNLSKNYSQANSIDESLDIDFTKRIYSRGGKTYEMDTTNIRSKPKSKINDPPQRQRTKKQKKLSIPEPLTDQAKQVLKGETWKLGKSHYLFCGDSGSSKFQKLLPTEISLLLVFPQTSKQWPPAKPPNVVSALCFFTPFREEMLLDDLRPMIEKALISTTDENDTVLMMNLPDSSLFILMENLNCTCYCAEPDPQRCTDALTAWAAINQTMKKL